MSCTGMLRENRTVHLEQLRSAKELIEDNIEWLRREGPGKIGVRLIDLSSILDKDHHDIEEHAPIEEAINYAATGSDAIFEFVDAATYTDSSNEPNPELVDKLTRNMGEIQAMLEEIPGFVPEGYIPGSPWSYYFLGVTNQGKGLIACVNEMPRETFNDKDGDIPF